MKKIILILAISLMGFYAAFAQAPTDTLNLSVKNDKEEKVALRIYGANDINVTGSDADGLVIETFAIPVKLTGRNDDLKDVTSLFQKAPAARSPFQVSGSGEMYRMVMCNFKKDQNVFIKVPHNVKLSIQTSSQLPGGKMIVKNLSGSIDLDGTFSSADISDVTGPLTVVMRDFVKQPAKLKITNVHWQEPSYYNIPNGSLAINIISMGRDVDLSLPASLQAKVHSVTNRGKLYSDLNWVTQPSKKDSQNAFNGTLNGGGLSIFILNTYGNTYIRKE